MVYHKKNKNKTLTLKRLLAALPFLCLPLICGAAESIALKEIPAQGPYIETIRVEMFCVPEDHSSTWTDMSAWGGSFYSIARKKSVQVLPDHPELDYRLWLQDSIAPLAIILPGTGAHCSMPAAVALASLLYKDGFSAIIISGSFNYQFMESAGAHIVPGNPPDDAADVYNSLKAVIKDVENRYGKEKISGKSLVGLSMGGLHALFISSMDKGDNAINFDSFLAVDPPVDLLYASKQIDSVMNTWRNWPKDKINDEAIRGGTFYLAMLAGKINPADPLPLSNDEARLLIGASFRFGLSDTIYSIHRRHDFGIIKTPYSWFSRTALYKEIDNIDFYGYSETFLLQYYARENKGLTVEKMSGKGSLYSIADSLNANSKVRVIHTLNDFILRPEDPELLHSIFGERITFFDKGGHLGNLYTPEVQSRIIKYMRGNGPFGFFNISANKAAKILYPTPYSASSSKTSSF
ncbi:MAG: hypothetical protein A2020_02750 [Lentisphaerae bacterium GWF2_45_14]|nr:MAG: hypothetical protein A2020_02750 [Lentisphaerae bacterium GWF2_45_14]